MDFFVDAVIFCKAIFMSLSTLGSEMSLNIVFFFAKY